MRQYFFFYLMMITLVLTVSCSPKVQEASKTVETPPPPPEVKEVDPNGCIKFTDLSVDRADVITDKYNIYRDRIKEKNWKAAYPDWKAVYEEAPSTNGRIDYVFRDGIKIYTAFAESTADSVLHGKYVDTMMMIYEKAVICFPEKKSYYMSKKGFDMYYKYKGRASEETMYAMFKEVVDIDKNEAKVSTIIPFSTLNYKMYTSGQIEVEEARANMENVNSIVTYRSENCAEKECSAWTQVEQYTLELTSRYERKAGFFECDYFVEKYYGNFEDQPQNCEVIEDTYRTMRRGGCGKGNPKVAAVYDAYQNSCRIIEDGPLKRAKKCLEKEDYLCAIQNYEEYLALPTTTDNEKKAKYNLRIAKIFYAHMGKFSRAREYARKAIKLNPNWGEPYVVIGRMYASSGPLCGPGTGFKSQVVTWVAIDKWEKAKSIDPTVSKEANKLIRQYSKYMPSKADIFQRNLKTGANFKVGCWIQENTKIRPAP